MFCFSLFAYFGLGIVEHFSYLADLVSSYICSTSCSSGERVGNIHELFLVHIFFLNSVLYKSICILLVGFHDLFIMRATRWSCESDFLWNVLCFYKYGQESWILNKTAMKKFESFEIWIFGRVLRTSWVKMMSRFYAEWKKSTGECDQGQKILATLCLERDTIYGRKNYRENWFGCKSHRRAKSNDIQPR